MLRFVFVFLFANFLLSVSAKFVHADVPIDIVAKEHENYGRIIFKFPGPFQVRVSREGSIFIVKFEAPVSLDVTQLKLPNYIEFVRLDPDKRALRFSLRDFFRYDAKDAIDEFYLDLLSKDWSGLPPQLPREKLNELVLMARKYEALKGVKVLNAKKAKRIFFRVTDKNDASSVVFFIPPEISVKYSKGEKNSSVTFSQPILFNHQRFQKELEGIVSSVEFKKGKKVSVLSFKKRKNIRTRFYEEGDYIYLSFHRVKESPKLLKAKLTLNQEVKAKSSKVEKPAQKKKKSASELIRRESPISDARVVIEALPAPGEGNFFIYVTPRVPLAAFMKNDTLFIATRETHTLEVRHLTRGLLLDAPRYNLKKGSALVRFHLKAKKLVSVQPQSEGWTLIFDDDPLLLAKSLDLLRRNKKNGEHFLEAGFEQPGKPIFTENPENREKMILIPSVKEVYSHAQTRKFLEMDIQKSISGLVIFPKVDDLQVSVAKDIVKIEHSKGLALSSVEERYLTKEYEKSDSVIDAALWNDEIRDDFLKRERAILKSITESDASEKNDFRMMLARSYLANRLPRKAVSVLEFMYNQDEDLAKHPKYLFMSIIAYAASGAYERANVWLNRPEVKRRSEARVWRGYLRTKSEKYGKLTSEDFIKGDRVIKNYPFSLRAIILPAFITAAIKENQPVLARKLVREYFQLPERFKKPAFIALYNAQISVLLDEEEKAELYYEEAIKSGDIFAEMSARLGKAVFGIKTDRLSKEEIEKELETLALMWRGDRIEVLTNIELGYLKSRDGKWYEAFYHMERALRMAPDLSAARKMQDAMSAAFEKLFLDESDENLSKIDAIAIFKSFRSLLPPGDKGNVLVRHLAERMVELDLLNEAEKLLRYQVDNRLKGFEKIRVATRLAMIQYNNGKFLEALETLKKSQSALISPEFRRARMLLEVQVLGKLSRVGFALELLESLSQGRDIKLLRANLLWNSEKWEAAANNYEILLEDRWKKSRNLTEAERISVLRAAIGYALVEDRLGLARLRSKFLEKMSVTPDAENFDVISASGDRKTANFQQVVQRVLRSSEGTGFSEAYRARYPEIVTGKRN